MSEHVVPEPPPAARAESAPRLRDALGLPLTATERRLLFSLLAWKALALLCVLVAHPLLDPIEPLIAARHFQGYATLADAPRAWFSTFDAEHYLYLASEGYRPWEQSIVFPFLWPTLIRAASVLTFGDVFIASMLLANAFSLVGALWFFRWAREKLDEPSAKLGVWLLFLSPTAFVFSLPYAEALFLAAGAGTLLALERTHVIGASIFAALATAARNIGVTLAVPIVVVAVLKRKPVLLVAVLAAALAFLSHRWFLAVVLGDPTIYDAIQARWVAAPSPAKVFDVGGFVSALLSADRWHGVRGSLLDRALFVLGVGGALALLKKDRASGAFALCAIYVAAAAPSFISFSRYLLTAFPVFAWLGFAASTRPRLRLALVTLFSLTHLGLLVRHSAWHWVG